MTKNFDKNEYTKKYLKEQMTKKAIRFNKNNDEDMKLLDYLEDIPYTRGVSMNKYLKNLIKKDMAEHEKD